jgi:hypothetical protein
MDKNEMNNIKPKDRSERVNKKNIIKYIDSKQEP